MVSARKPTQKVPKNWPGEILYLESPAYAPSLSQIHTSSLRIATSASASIPFNTPKGPCPRTKISRISISSHPAFGQCGLFAACDLKPGIFILQYLGEVHAPSSPDSSTETDPHAYSDYDLSLDRELRIGIDADKMGNEARFINDYRGIAERPNVEFKEIWDERRKEKGMGVFVLPQGKKGLGKGIKKGEEMLVSYGRGFWGARRVQSILVSEGVCRTKEAP